MKQEREFYLPASMPWDIPYRNIFFVGLIIHIIVAWFSEGFQHPDEHFQIFELALGRSEAWPVELMPWEFKEKIRPWLQPLLTWWGPIGLFKTLDFSPFVQMNLVRVLYSIGSYCIWSYWAFLESAKEGLSQKKELLILGAFTWFMPYLQARTSSENFSVMLFLLAICFIHKKWQASAGFFFALSSFARFQMGIAVIPFFIHEIFFKQSEKNLKFKFLLGIIFGLFVGVLFDRIGYGEWTLTPWNYLKMNILEGKAASFGVSPWWYYFPLTILKGIPPLSLVFLISFIYFCIKKYKQPMVQAALLFFLVHSLIGHKELRFLNFLFFLTPFVLIWAYEKSEVRINRFFIKFLIVVNLGALFWVSFVPANGIIGTYRFLYSLESDTKIVAIREEPLFKLEMNFYNPKKIKLEYVESHFETELKKFSLITSNQKQFDMVLKQKKFQCELVYSRRPLWFNKIEIFKKIIKPSGVGVWNCRLLF